MIILKKKVIFKFTKFINKYTNTFKKDKNIISDNECAICLEKLNFIDLEKGKNMVIKTKM